jgi:hypothetical protein
MVTNTKQGDTVTELLFEYITVILVNFSSVFDDLLSTDKTEQELQGELLEGECFIFVISWLTISLKRYNIINKKQDTKKFSDILDKIFEMFIDYQADLYDTDILEKIVKVYLDRYDIYEDAYVDDMANFLQSFINIIWADFMILDVYTKSIKKIRAIRLDKKHLNYFLKLSNNIETLITLFFKNGIDNYFNKNNNELSFLNDKLSDFANQCVYIVDKTET